MQHFKHIIATADMAVTALWGVCVIDLLPFDWLPTILSHVDIGVQKMIAIGGLIFLYLRIHNYWHINKINRDIKRAELKKLTNENEKFNSTNSDNIVG